ncbi:MAG: 5-amino-6-(5-phosphoribosylamino)uracil reductase, partial [Chloroflexia bacterium]|nr:5-amino-6-(5-phosphoribosylamino)uracil reductase [Chloroflexia bacterium]
MSRPRVTLSYAQTLDGRLATRSGSSQWISGAESLRFSHE